MHWAVFPGHSFTLLHIALNLLLDSSALWTPGALFGCLNYLVSPLPDHWFPLFWVLGACSASVGLCSLESALQSDGLFLPFGFFQLNFCVESDPSCCLFNFCPGFLSRAGGETTVAGDGRVTSLSHALTRLYSVKYLFLHYFTRVVFTKTLQKFPKHRHAEEKNKSTMDLVTSNWNVQIEGARESLDYNNPSVLLPLHGCNLYLFLVSSALTDKLW